MIVQNSMTHPFQHKRCVPKPYNNYQFHFTLIPKKGLDLVPMLFIFVIHSCGSYHDDLPLQCLLPSDSKI